MGLSLTSTAFDAGGAIPATYTCDGADISPPLSWSGIPSGAKSLALIVDDPDSPDPAAPQGTWVHWVLYNIPVSTPGLQQELRQQGIPHGVHEGLNDWKRVGYGGPCPSVGRHRYVHTLYALDATLPDLGNPSKSQLENAMQGHVIEQAELVGLYARK